MAGGRPSKYSQEVAEAICERLSEGESLLSISKDPAMPARSTILKWRNEIEEFSASYARAYEMGADIQFDELEELAATATPETVGVVKLQLDARKWALARRLPKKYGDKVTQEVTGADGGPINTAITVRFVEGDDDGDNDSGSV